ncbi:HD-GYP domain-containing protein [Desulfovibrio sp. JC010]|uniref:HD-GYP domain-containing protein n=1 Tax=Desulfovibrio sp. JC010 TaxID=2593641 RepID=UPI0013CFD924|nr:HD domain-containing phosphohydrolase [Desulfovibrio sp. JC010]NDV28663.1 metal-dependent phosphohydrolase [Desulfovibrio sp. JC010]
MNAIDDSKLIEESFCSITGDIFKILPKSKLPFCLYRMNSSNGRFTPITIPGKAIVSADKQTIATDCNRGLIFIKFTDINQCRPYFLPHLPTVISDISHSIPENELAALLLEGLKGSAEKIYTDSIKLHFKDFRTTLISVGELLHEKPELLWMMIPLLDSQHSLVNKALSNGIIGAAVLLHAREMKPDVKIFVDALFALFLCDIGLCNLPEFVLGKEFCLSLDEQKRIRQHPIGSVEVLSMTGSLNKTSLRAILEHHERMDGSGYPRGVTNENLSWLGKLCGAVDSYVAMTMGRPGKKSMDTVKALKILYSESTQYDPNIIYALEKVTYREE